MPMLVSATATETVVENANMLWKLGVDTVCESYQWEIVQLNNRPEELLENSRAFIAIQKRRLGSLLARPAQSLLRVTAVLVLRLTMALLWLSLLVTVLMLSFSTLFYKRNSCVHLTFELPTSIRNGLNGLRISRYTCF